MLPFTRVTGTWDRPVYIVGGGPSIRGFDFSRLDGYLLGINKSAWLMCECDGLFSLDQQFTRVHRDDLQRMADAGKDVFLAMPPNEDNHRPVNGAVYLCRRRNPGLSDNPADIFGVNSGFGGLGLAYHKHPSCIGLLGFDMQYDPDGRTHCHDGYSWHNRRTHRWMDKWATNFDRAAHQLAEKGIEVVNFVGEPRSKITAFPVASLSDL